MITRLFKKRYVFTTLLVILLAVVFIRLGFWQLDRLAARKARAAATIAQMNAPTLNLNEFSLNLDLQGMEYRKVIVTGVYDSADEVVLRNQIWVDAQSVHHNGVHLLTPLHITGSQYTVLIDRGWIPAEESSQKERSRYSVTGTISVEGIVRTAQSRSEMGMVKEPTLAVGETRRDVWNFANLAEIGKQLEYPILPVYIQEEPHDVDNELPYAIKEYPDLSQGAHLGFAFQWFALAVIALVGYLILVGRQPEN
jgi:surfeit locus 1 family protein